MRGSFKENVPLLPPPPTPKKKGKPGNMEHSGTWKNYIDFYGKKILGIIKQFDKNLW